MRIGDASYPKQIVASAREIYLSSIGGISLQGTNFKPWLYIYCETVPKYEIFTKCYIW